MTLASALDNPKGSTTGSILRSRAPLVIMTLSGLFVVKMVGTGNITEQSRSYFRLTERTSVINDFIRSSPSWATLNSSNITSSEPACTASRSSGWDKYDMGGPQPIPGVIHIEVEKLVHELRFSQPSAPYQGQAGTFGY